MSFTNASTDFLKKNSLLGQNAGQPSAHHPLWTKAVLVRLFSFSLRSALVNLHGEVDYKGVTELQSYRASLIFSKS